MALSIHIAIITVLWICLFSRVQDLNKDTIIIFLVTVTIACKIHWYLDIIDSVY